MLMVLIIIIIVTDRFLYSAILRSRADSLRSHVILHEWLGIVRQSKRRIKSNPSEAANFWVTSDLLSAKGVISLRDFFLIFFF